MPFVRHVMVNPSYIRKTIFTFGWSLPRLLMNKYKLPLNAKRDISKGEINPYFLLTGIFIPICCSSKTTHIA